PHADPTAFHGAGWTSCHTLRAYPSVETLDAGDRAAMAVGHERAHRRWASRMVPGGRFCLHRRLSPQRPVDALLSPCDAPAANVISGLCGRICQIVAARVGPGR